jgi:hypothetical protein
MAKVVVGMHKCLEDKGLALEGCLIDKLEDSVDREASWLLFEHWLG